MATIVEALAVAVWRPFYGRRIVITHPRNDEMLADAETLNQECIAFSIWGMLKRFPKDHEIWLLTQDETTGRV